MYHKLAHYKCAGKLLQEAKENGKNVKTTLYNDKKYKFMNIKSLYALVNEALKHWEVLQALIKDSNILVDEAGLNIWHVRILITELLFGKKVIDGENKFGEIILRYENKFKELLSTSPIKKLFKKEEPTENVKVRYIKVNTIKESIDSVINCFVNEGWNYLETADSYEGYLGQLRELELSSQQFTRDFHIPEVLAFPPGTELYFHELYKNGSITLMDKSSCLAPYLLRPHSGSIVLDMCAAPGLKTVHLAGIIQTGKVYAVERDAKRFTSLQEMLRCCEAGIVVPIQSDVTKLDVQKYADVEYILLDPSCSGSGIRDRQLNIEHETYSNDQNRLYRLAGFQLTLLRFALTRFPAAKRVVYSTCSVNVEENEEVVQSALNSKYHDFDIVSINKRLPQWINFGSNDFEFGSKCIYSLPDTDLTNGFFVAVFERKKHYLNDKTNDFNRQTDGSEYNSQDNEEKHDGKMKFNKEITQVEEINLANDNITEKNYLSETTKTEHFQPAYENDVVLSKKRKYVQHNENYPVQENTMYSETFSGDTVKNNLNTFKDSLQPHNVEMNNKDDVGVKKKLSVSAKKRIRQRKKKIANNHNTLSKPKKDKTKINSKKLTSAGQNSKSSKGITNVSQKNDKPFSKAQLRYKRLKALKVAKLSNDEKRDNVSNNSDSVNHGRKKITAKTDLDSSPSILSNSLDVIDNDTNKEKSNKKKRKNVELNTDEFFDANNDMPTSEPIESCKKKIKHKTDKLIVMDNLVGYGTGEVVDPSCEINSATDEINNKKRNKTRNEKVIENDYCDEKDSEFQLTEVNGLSSKVKKSSKKSLNKTQNVTLDSANNEINYLEVKNLNHSEIIETHIKKSKKKKKDRADNLVEMDCVEHGSNVETSASVKKKKRRSKTEIENIDDTPDKHKNDNSNKTDLEYYSVDIDEALLPTFKKKKRKHLHKELEENNENGKSNNLVTNNDLSQDEVIPTPIKKRKKHDKSLKSDCSSNVEIDVHEPCEIESSIKKHKSKKKKKSKESMDESNEHADSISDGRKSEYQLT